MTFAANVQGGTGAGTKQPFRGDRPDWTCPNDDCALEVRGYWLNCPGCGERSPKP